MCPIRKMFLAVLVSTVSFCGVCLGGAAGKSGDMATDFNQAFEAVLQQPGRSQRLMYHDFQSAAEDFVSKHSDIAAIEFARAKITDAKLGKLALLIVAKLAPDNQAAKEILFDEIHGRNPRALIAIAYLDPNDGRPLAESLLADTGTPGVHKAAVDMLIGMGNERTLNILRRVATSEKRPFVIQALNSAVRRLEHRLTNVPMNKQTQWAQQEIMSWRAVAETPLPRYVGGEYIHAAEALYVRGIRFTREFLEYRVDADGDLFALAAIGNQKEVWAVQSLERYIKQGDTSGDIARVSLAKIGTNEALRVLESSIIPSGSNRANTHILSLLEVYGDQDSAVFLEVLSGDERFSGRQRTLLRVASNSIRSRIAQGLNLRGL